MCGGGSVQRCTLKMLLVLLTGEIVAFKVADGPGERVELKI
jgi:hypothetical protein